MNKHTLRVVTTANAPKLQIGKPAFIPLLEGKELYINEVVDFEERWDCIFVETHTATFKINIKNTNLPKEMLDILKKYNFSYKYVLSNAEYRDLEVRSGKTCMRIHFKNDDNELERLIKTLKRRIVTLFMWDDSQEAATWGNFISDLEDLYLSKQQKSEPNTCETPFKIVRDGKTIYLTEEELKEMRRIALILDGRDMILNSNVEPEPQFYDKWVESDGKIYCAYCGALAPDKEARMLFKYCPCCGGFMASSKVLPSLKELAENDELCLKIAETYEEQVHSNTGELENRIIHEYIAKYLKGE